MQWKEVRYYADQIEQQLATPVVPMQTSRQPELKVVKKSSSQPWIFAGSVIIVAAFAFFISQKEKKEKPRQVSLQGPILVPDGEYVGPDGNRSNIRKFWMASHEVTIGEYREFLDFLQIMEEDQRKIFDHESQPVSKISHEVADWSNILAAAQKGQLWKGRLLSVNCPMFGVDWWDAHAYCEWKRARLPSQEEWYAALMLETTDPNALKPKAWGEVQSFDQNGAGFFGLAGGVSEWTRRPASDPTNPLGARKWVIIGASFSNPANGPKAREWTSQRELRRDDLGFRIAYDHLPD
jgi:formylglycine-generating enzyme required for sulfatase activity